MILLSHRVSKRAYQCSTSFSIISCLLILSPLLFIKSYILPFQDSNFLPLGISFFSLQAVSYFLDVKKGLLPPQSLFSTALYLSFFPQLVAGPIEKPKQLIQRLRHLKAPSNSRLYYSFSMILIALFKKQVLGDRFYDLYAMQGSIALSTFCFGLFIYFDFSAYCQIARASAMLFGVKISQNFKRPYLASNLKDFWMRWHTSLRRFFVDYVYIPLGGNTKVFASFMVFLISAIWHGLTIGFLLWGIWHFLFHTLSKKIRFGFILTQVLVFSSWFLFQQSNWSFISSPSIKSEAYTFQFTHLFLLILGSAYFYWEYLEEFSKTKVRLLRKAYQPWFLLTLLFLIVLFGKTQSKLFLYYRF
ncbi:MAG: MBOAT family protein [Candidatus Cloacimonetes bacterium]|nr:MBOAT family protein [Candidatus Cloacimonadota bacterium]